MNTNMVGQIVADEYTIQSHIGGGGMAQVYLAASQDKKKQVAIKIMNSELVHKSTAVARFKREARLQCKVNHPNLVKGYSTGSFNGAPYLIMEYVDGPMLSDLIAKREYLPPEESIKILYDLVSALSYLFKTETIHAHRDIKPQNIMITKNGTAKLTDFGIAKAFDEKEAVTLTSSFLGSPHYMSPEQIKSPRDVDIRSDLYALGTVFYEMLTGKKAFDGVSTKEILDAHFDLEAPRLVGDDKFTKVCNDVFESTMAKDPADRYQVPSELKDALDAYVDSTIEIKEPRFSRSTIRFAAILAATLVVSTVLVVSIIFFMPDTTMFSANEPRPVQITQAQDEDDFGLYDDDFEDWEDWEDDEAARRAEEIRREVEAAAGQFIAPEATGGAQTGEGGGRRSVPTQESGVGAIIRENSR